MSKASRLLKICEQGTILYHGTSEFSWSNNSEESILYLTDSLKDAENYAYEMAAHDEEEGKTSSRPAARADERVATRGNVGPRRPAAAATTAGASRPGADTPPELARTGSNHLELSDARAFGLRLYSGGVRLARLARCCFA